jgi:hypothetical protein
MLEDQVDMAAFRRMLAPDIALHLADDMEFVRDLRAHLAQTGSTYLLPSESLDGMEHRYTLRDVR